MAVDITNLEATQKVDLKLENQTTASAQTDEVNSQKKESKDTPDNKNEKNTIDKYENNYKTALNSGLKNTIEATTISLRAETGLDKIKTNLNELRETANKVGLGNLTEDELYKAQYEFETLKNNLTQVSKEATYKGQNLYETLNSTGIQYQVNKETNIGLAFKKSEEEIAGFNKNNLTIENLNVYNTENAMKTADSLNKAINYVDQKKDDLNSSQKTINDELTKLISSKEAGYISLNSNEEAKKETSSVAALILGNSNETSMAQANSRYENYLNLLKVPMMAESE